MKKVNHLLLFALVLVGRGEALAAEPEFEKVSDHCYYLQLEDGGPNVAVVTAEDGVLMINPPREQNLPFVLDALNRLSQKPVRWVAFTDSTFSQTAGARYFAEKGAVFLGSAKLRALAESQPDTIPVVSFPLIAEMTRYMNSLLKPTYRWFIFDREMRLFPSHLEIHIQSLQYKARSGGDVYIYVPAEKVLFVGELYESARYPDIDMDSQGSALQWIEGLEQVIDSTPVLKPAIPEKDFVAEDEEEGRTLEEGITVVSSHGEVSNLQNMKDLLEACRKLQRYASRWLQRGRNCERFLASSVSNPYYSYGNLPSYAAQLFEALETPAKQTKTKNP